MHKPLLSLLFFLTSLLLAGCGEETASTQILVTVKATREVAFNLRSVRVRTEWQATDGTMTTGSTERPIAFDPLESDSELSFGVLPKANATQVVIRVTGYDVGVEEQSAKHVLDEKTVTALFEKGRVVRVELTLGEEATDGGMDAGQLPLCDEDAGVTEDCGVAVPSFVGAANMGLLYADGTDDITVLPGETWTFYTGADGLGAGAIKHDDTDIRAVGEGIKAGIGFALIPQGDGEPSLAVFYMNSLTVPEGTTVKAVGDNALVLLSREAMTIDGTVHVNAVGAVGGAGGRDGAEEYVTNANRHPQDGNALTKPTAGTSSQIYAGGSGGGANGGAGGAGGRGAWRDLYTSMPIIPPKDYAGGPGGAAVSSVDGDVLIGGGGGGAASSGQGRRGVWTAYPSPAGGGGGGALQLVSAVRIFIGIKGSVSALGAGGTVTPDIPYRAAKMGPGTGGGAGGTLVLEAPDVSVAGVLAANGGGGSGGDVYDQNLSPGADGTPTTDRAQGSPGISDPSPAKAVDRAGDGGDGAAGTFTDGENGQDEHGVDEFGEAGAHRYGGSGGGGGGGAGRIVIHSLAGPVAPDANALFSPSLTTGLVILDGVMRVRALP